MKFRGVSTYIYIRMETFRLTLMLLFISIAANADNEIFTTNISSTFSIKFELSNC